MQAPKMVKSADRPLVEAKGKTKKTSTFRATVMLRVAGLSAHAMWIIRQPPVLKLNLPIP
jgi:hypothetical protein